MLLLSCIIGASKPYTLLQNLGNLNEQRIVIHVLVVLQPVQT